MKKNIYVVVFSFLPILMLLTNCTNSYDIKSALSNLRGLQVSVPIHKWGYPNEEKCSIIEDKKIFIWSTDRRDMSYNRKNVSHNYTYNPGHSKWEAISRTTSTLNQGLNDIWDKENYCIIKVITNNNNIIEFIEYEGGQCRRYTEKLTN